jgi:hypothetical protein
MAKDGSPRANARDIVFPDGRSLYIGSSGTGAPYDETRQQQAPAGEQKPE